MQEGFSSTAGLPAKARAHPPSSHVSRELGMTRNDMIRFIVWEWMEKNSYLPVHELYEYGDVDGSA